MPKLKIVSMVGQRFFIITTVVFMVLSLTFGSLYWHSKNEIRSAQDNQDGYQLLAKRLFLENPSDVLINFEPLRKEIRDYLTNTGLTHSFYFEYLFTGSNIRAGEDNKLVGASLMKIPIVMDLYKAVEKGKIDLDRQVAVAQDATEASTTDEGFGNTRNLKTGSQISLREAAKIALIESDNTAAYTVFEATKDLLPPEEKAINSLDVETQVSQAGDGNYALIDARSYSSFLKCLYFSCFLSRENSQEILSHLTKSADYSRIRAGVPGGLEVAHKIGSFSDVTQSDCGIVYASNRRYIICLMLDTDARTASQLISKVSEMAYNYVSTAN